MIASLSLLVCTLSELSLKVPLQSEDSWWKLNPTNSMFYLTSCKAKFSRRYVSHSRHCTIKLANSIWDMRYHSRKQVLQSVHYMSYYMDMQIRHIKCPASYHAYIMFFSG